MTASVDRIVDAAAEMSDRAGFIGRAHFELCMCRSCKAARPERRSTATLAVFRAARRRCPSCGASRGLAGGLCRVCLNRKGT